MFWFFRRTPKGDPPTEKQLRYAQKIGIRVTSRMTRKDLSAAISDAEEANPTLQQEREEIVAKSRMKKYGIRCVECKARVSDKASFCSNCGAPTTQSNKETFRIPTGCGCLIVIVVVGVIIYLSSGRNNNQVLRNHTAARHDSPNTCIATRVVHDRFRSVAQNQSVNSTLNDCNEPNIVPDRYSLVSHNGIENTSPNLFSIDLKKSLIKPFTKPIRNPTIKCGFWFFRKKL